MGLMGLEGDGYVRYVCALQCVRKMTNLQQAMTLYDEDLQKIKKVEIMGAHSHFTAAASFSFPTLTEWRWSHSCT